MNEPALNELKQRREPWTAAERALWVAISTARSEARRKDKLALRPDALARLEAAQAKRAARRSRNVDGTTPFPDKDYRA